MKRQLVTAAALSLALTACGTVMNGQREALSVAERHPITVDRQTVTVTIPVDGTRQGLSRETHAQLDAFLTLYRTRGEGPITVTAPSGTASRDMDGQETAANIREALNGLGLAYADMRGATYRADGGERDVIVSFSQYVAQGPECGIFNGEVKARLRNVPAPNFGCADQNNLAAMVADPRDLTRMQTPAPTNGAAVAAAARALSTGTTTWDEEGAMGATLSGGGSQ
jgi:pilus assembly protein CpaD